MQRIAVLGHSYGGYTALAMGGARINFTELSARCAALPPDDIGQYMCAPLVDHGTDMAALAGLESPPEGLWPSWYDPRIKAIGSFAGDSYPFGFSGLTEITIPVLVMGGSYDMGTPLEWGSYPVYENASSAQKAMVVFDNADHSVFTASCSDTQWLVDTGWSMFCLEGVWNMDRIHDLTNHFTTAFLLTELYEDEDAATALAPENVQFPGVEYEAEGF
jgi:predicted dienelactone hydrolase